MALVPVQPWEIRRSGGVTMIAFPPGDLRVVAAPQGGRHVTPMGPMQGADAIPGAYAAIDGPMFGICDGQPDVIAASNEVQKYARSQCAVVDYSIRDANAGFEICGGYPTRGITIGVDGGRATVSDGAVCPGSARVAVQLYPTMVRNGSAVGQSSAGENNQAVQRAALCVLSDGRLAFAAGALSMSDFAHALVSLGAHDAGYTDGGGSTSLVTPQGRVGSSEMRRVACWLVAAPQPSGISSIFQPLVSTPARRVALGIAVGAAVVAIAAAIAEE